MAGISSGGGSGGRKRVDQEIPLIPFIDLLLCCVMFLLVTAIWNETGEVPTELTSAAREEGPDVDAPRDSLILEITDGGFVLASTAGDRIDIPATEGELDFASLDQRLAERHRLQPNVPPVKVRPDDDISTGNVVTTMDVLRRRGYASLSFL
jgi:biopolymer transport protein ExbD